MKSTPGQLAASQKYKAKNKKKALIDNLKWEKTKMGMVSRMYTTQRVSSKKRGMSMPNYTLNEFREWITSQSNFETLYQNWVNSDYDKKLKPSCDRLEEDKSYSFDNIELVTWKINDARNHQGLREGKNSRSVLQICLKTEEILDEFCSVSEAERTLKIHAISRVLSPKYSNKTSGGFAWKYKE